MAWQANIFLMAREIQTQSNDAFIFTSEIQGTIHLAFPAPCFQSSEASYFDCSQS